MPSPWSLALGLATLILLPGRAPAEEPGVTRAEIETLESALDTAVGRVSHPSSRLLLGAAETRGYPLKGYGVFFVLSPRALPPPPGLLARRGAGASTRRGARDRDLQAIEDEVEALQREAEAARQEAERAFEEMARQMQEQAQPIPRHAAAARSPEPLPAPEAPAAPAAPSPPPAVPAAAETPAPPPIPSRDPLPPPPWAFWFGTQTEDQGSPAQVVGAVQAAIQGVLEAAGSRLGGLGPDEFVVVAVDFVSPGSLLEPAGPEHTLVVRARKRDLDARQAGRIDSRELARRIEFAEY